MENIKPIFVKQLLDKLDYLKKEEIEEVENTVDFIIDKHQNQFRKSGEPYYLHPIEAAKIIADLKLDKTTIIATLLHDVVEDTDVTLEEIKEKFGEKVAQIVDGVTKIGKYNFENIEDAKVENFRKLIVSTANDIRVIIVKLADRLHNIKTLSHLREEKQKRIAKETLEIYAPLASRLGLWNIKRELEDYSFMYLYPEDYKKIVTYFAHSKEKNTKYLEEKVIPKIKKTLEEHNINADIQYRSKHLYSIYEKTKRKNLKLSDIYDVFGVRVLVDDVKDCYLVLGIIHSIWTPVPGKFKDYISLPKSNFYQALHTTVVGPDGKFVEIQIKTYQMHKIAEEGIAAHWIYKGGKDLTEKDAQNFLWLKNLLETLKGNQSSEIIDDISKDLSLDEIFVFTPKGDLIKLPSGATPVDFAYAIHTAIGHKTIGAKVNSRFVPLDTKLKSGDVVEIITKEGHNPSRDWLNFVVTSKAKTNIKQFISKIEREKSIKFGEKLLDKFLKKINKKTTTLTEEEKKELTKKYNYKTFEDFLAAVGDSKISPAKIVKFLNGDKEEKEEKFSQTKKAATDISIEVDGVSNILSHISKCCLPLPGDEIVGIITKGKGIGIHRKKCPYVKQTLEQSPEKVVNVVWGNNIKHVYNSEIKVFTEDKPGILASVSNSIANAKSNITSAMVKTLKSGNAIIDFKLQVKNKEHLLNIIKSIKNTPGVISVHRVLKRV